METYDWLPGGHLCGLAGSQSFLPMLPINYMYFMHILVQKQMIGEIFSFLFWKILSLLIDFLILKIGMGIMNANAFWVKIVDNVIVVIANYLFSKVFIFKNKTQLGN